MRMIPKGIYEYLVPNWWNSLELDLTLLEEIYLWESALNLKIHTIPTVLVLPQGCVSQDMSSQLQI